MGHLENDYVLLIYAFAALEAFIARNPNSHHLSNPNPMRYSLLPPLHPLRLPKEPTRSSRRLTPKFRESAVEVPPRLLSRRSRLCRLLGKQDCHHPRVNHHDVAAKNEMIEETPTDNRGREGRDGELVPPLSCLFLSFSSSATTSISHPRRLTVTCTGPPRTRACRARPRRTTTNPTREFRSSPSACMNA